MKGKRKEDLSISANTKHMLKVVVLMSEFVFMMFSLFSRPEYWLNDDIGIL